MASTIGDDYFMNDWDATKQGEYLDAPSCYDPAGYPPLADPADRQKLTQRDLDEAAADVGADTIGLPLRTEERVK